MKRFILSLAALLLLACSLPGTAQDGPLRQRLRERWLQRQQQEPAPAPTASTDDKIERPGGYVFTLRHQGQVRVYRVHVPAKYEPAVPAPLLVALHGGGGNMDYQADDAHYGLIAKSEEEGFVAVFPNGYSRLPSGKFATWNAGACCAAARDADSDDVGFIRQVVANLVRQMNIDRGRIYATGMSNGAMMAYRLACELPDVFKAIAAVAGTDNTRDCRPARPVSILHIHARNDNHVLFNGGAGPGLRDKSMVSDFSSVPATIAKWTRLDGCSATPTRVLQTPGAACDAYPACRSGSEVRLCVTETGGHSWPGAILARGEPASKAISADDVMWQFFERH